MFEPILKAIETRLKEKAPNFKLVDLWNNQPQNTEEEKQILPAIYVDFGEVQWRTQDDIMQGTTVLTVYVCYKSIRDTSSRATDIDTKRLAKLGYIAEALNALHKMTGKDSNDNIVLKGMQLVSTQLDTNHDALHTDELRFNAMLWYFGTYFAKHKEGLIEDVEDEYIGNDI